MLALKSFLASLLRGGREPRHLFSAVVLGFTAGCVCGWNLTFAALVCLAALLNCSTTLLIASALCGGLATLCTSGAARSLGALLLDKCGLGAQLAKLGTGPFVALFRLDDYTVFGSLAAGLALSIPAAQVFSRYATHRRSLLNLTLARLTETREPLFRPLGPAAATCCLMATGLLVQVQGPRLVREGLLEHLTAALGTEVTADVVSYDLWSGDLQLTNLRIADAAKPSDVALVVEGVSARVEPGLLLRGRLACDEMTVAGLFCDPTKLSQTAPTGMFAKGPTLLKEDFAQPTHNEDPLRAVEVQGFVRNWSGVCDRLLVLERLVGFVEKVADLETTVATNHALKKCLERRRPQRDAISGALIPLAQVKSMKIERLPSSWKLSAHSALELTDLTSNPKLATRSASLSFHDAERQVKLTAVFNLLAPERRHEVTLAANDVAIESLVSSHATRGSLEPLTSSTTSVEARGWITRENLELELSTSLKGLQAAQASGPFAGIDGAIWRQGLQKLGTLPLEASLRGRWSNPKLTLVPSEVVYDFKQNLQAAGAHEIVKSFETNKPVPVSASPKALAATTPTVEAKPSALQPAATLPAVGGLSSGIAANTPPVPPMQPLTIQPMAMTGSLFPPAPTTTAAAATTSSAPKTSVATAQSTAAQPSALQPAAASTTNALNNASAISAATKAQTELLLAGSPLKPASPAQLAATQPVPATSLKTLPKDTFAVVGGNPWTAPEVVQGTPIPATTATVAAKPQPATTTTAATTTAAAPAATAQRAPIGIASDTAVAGKPADPSKSSDVSKSAEASKPATVASQAPTTGAVATSGIASATSTAQTPATAKAPQPAGVAPIPTTVDATAGLRQPLSVLEPNAAPGPINMTVGYDADRGLNSPAETASKAATTPAKPKMPAFEELPQVSREPKTASRDAASATRPSNKPRIETFDPSAGASERVASNPAPLPTNKPSAQSAPQQTPRIVRPPVADQVATNDDFEGEVREEPAPKRKSLMGTVTGWFGRGPKPEPKIVDRDVEAAVEPESNSVIEESKPAEKPKTGKKLFSKLKSIFGEQQEVEMLPPDETDRRVVPSTGDENDVTRVEPSSFDDATTDSKRAEAPAEFAADEAAAPATTKNATPPRIARPRTLDVPRTELSSRNVPKPLAEAAEFGATTKSEAPLPNDASVKSIDPTETTPTPPTTKKPTATRTAPQPTERISAGESFYNRMVR